MTRSVALALALLLLAGCTPARVLVAEAPPPQEQAEPRTRKPGPHCFWRSGHWAWSRERDQYFWDAGSWDASREDALWLPGHWERVTEDGRTGWVWVEPTWEPIPRRR
jgi:hypothetical protein